MMMIYVTTFFNCIMCFNKLHVYIRDEFSNMQCVCAQKPSKTCYVYIPLQHNNNINNNNINNNNNAHQIRLDLSFVIRNAL